VGLADHRGRRIATRIASARRATGRERICRGVLPILGRSVRLHRTDALDRRAAVDLHGSAAMSGSVPVSALYAGLFGLFAVLLANNVLYARLRAAVMPKWKPDAQLR